jgi:hypothetical protein
MEEFFEPVNCFVRRPIHFLLQAMLLASRLPLLPSFTPRFSTGRELYQMLRNAGKRLSTLSYYFFAAGLRSCPTSAIAS